MFQEKSADTTKTHILCSVTFLDNRVVYETTWKNFVEPDRPQMKIRSMRIALWIPKSANTHTHTHTHTHKHTHTHVL